MEKQITMLFPILESYVIIAIVNYLPIKVEIKAIVLANILLVKNKILPLGIEPSPLSDHLIRVIAGATGTGA
jgi:hypothetical protein